MTTRNDLAWLANCYVLGELSADESAAFELRMVDDLTACEAVAKATQMNLAVVAAFGKTPAGGSTQAIDRAVVQPSTFNPQPSTRTAVAALVATVIAVASLVLMVGRGLVENGIARRDGTDKLVAAWASGEAARNAADDDDLMDSGDAADLEPPDWMLAALTAEGMKEQRPNQDDVREN